MATGRGSEVIIGFKKMNANPSAPQPELWKVTDDTASKPALVGANDGIQPISMGYPAGGPVSLPDDSFKGRPWRAAPDQGEHRADQDITCYLKYDGHDVLIAMAMGTAGTPTQGGTTSAYYNAYKIKDNLSGLYGTLAMETVKDTLVKEIDAAKVNGIRVRGEAGKRVEITFPFLGRRRRTDSPRNTTSTIDSVTPPVVGKFCHFNDVEIRLGDQSWGALSSSNEVFPSAFEIVVDNAMTGEITMENAPYIDEPERTDFGTVTLTLTFPKHTTNTWINKYFGKTKLKAMVRFLGPNIEASYNYMMTFWFPELTIESADTPVGGPGKITLDLPMVASWYIDSTTGPAGMTGIGTPLNNSYEAWSNVVDSVLIEIVNKRTTNPLA